MNPKPQAPQIAEEGPGTDCSTPPQVDQPPPSVVHPSQHHSIIQSIISSNEELLLQQTMAIKELQKENYQQAATIKKLSQKYENMKQFANSSVKSAAEAKTKGQPAGHKLNDKVFDVEQMLERISQLQQQLSKAKVQVALKEEELLSFSLRKGKEAVNQANTNKSINRNSLSDYFEAQPYQRYGPQEQKGLAQHSQLTQQWIKHLETVNCDVKVEKFKDKTTSLIKKFIPRELRNKVWPLLVQNKLGMTNSLYIHLLQRRNNGWICPKVKQQIDKDIKRSFYGKTQYETQTGLISEVCQFLELFHIFRPDVSYIQGMTYPAIILIPILGKIKAFNVFCNLLLGNTFFRKIFSLQEGFVESICRTFQLLLADTHPSISSKLQKAGVESQIFLIEWLFTLFSRGLSFEVTLKVWDHMLFFQQLAVFRIALGILQQVGPLLMNLGYQQIIELIRNYGEHIDESKMLETICGSKVSREKLMRTYEKLPTSK